MKVYESVCGDVCHQICHGVYDQVSGNAERKFDNTFTVSMLDGRKFYIQFTPSDVTVYEYGSNSSYLMTLRQSFEWTVRMSIMEIADKVVETCLHKDN